MRFIDLTTKYHITRDRLFSAISIICILIVSTAGVLITKTVLDNQTHNDMLRRQQQAEELAAATTETSESATSETTPKEESAVAPVVPSSVTDETSSSEASSDVSESIEDNCDSKEENETDTVASQTTEVTETKQESKQVYNDESSDYRDGCFSIDKDNCLIIGASVRGKGHIQTDLPCQDSNKYTYLTKGWGIAVVSDGAGSATKSQIGSRLVVERATKHFMEVIKEMAWVERNELPSDLEWAQIAYSVLRRVYVDIGNFAQQKNINIKELNATAIVLIHSPFGLLSTHIGDGRAGYRNNSGEWLPVIVPHKGEEASQTIFITSQFWDRPSFRMSDHLIPDSVVIREKITGFTLMSDGCENTSWQVSQMDTNTGKVCDPNRPFRGFFDPLTNTLVKFHNDRIDVNKRSEAWYSFLDTGREFSKEVDDKTLILGIIL